MTEEYKEILADGAREALRRSPLAVILVISLMIISYIGWQLLSGNARERAELRAQNAQLTNQLVDCYRARPAGTARSVNRRPPAIALSQSDRKK